MHGRRGEAERTEGDTMAINVCSECGVTAAQGINELGGEGAAYCPAHPSAVIETVSAPAFPEFRAAVAVASRAWTGLDFEVDETDVSTWARILRARATAGDGIRDDSASVTSWGDQTGNFANQEHAHNLRRLERSIREGVDADQVEDLADQAESLAGEAESDVETAAAEAADLGARAIAALEAGNYDAAKEALDQACALESKYGDCPAWGAVRRAIPPRAEIEISVLVREINAAGLAERVQVAATDAAALAVLGDEIDAHPSLQVDATDATITSQAVEGWFSVAEVAALISGHG